MNRRRQHFNWFRIVFFCLLIAAGLYLDKYVIPTAPSPFQPTATPTRPPEAYLTEAQTLFDQGKLNQSIQAYQQAIAVQPEDSSIYVELARVQVFAGDYEGAKTSAEDALLLNPNNSMAFAVRAWALDFQGDYLGAEDSIKRALEIDDKNPRAHAYYAEILTDEAVAQGADTIQKAIDESNLAKTLAPDTLESHRARGYVLENTANYEDAIREYEAAITINKNISMLHLAMGRNYYALGIYDKAIDEYTLANTLNPSDATPDFLTSRTYAVVGQFSKAMQFAETAVKDDPTNARYHGNLGVMLYKNALYVDAVKELGLAVNGGLTDDGQKVESVELVPNSPRLAEIYFTYALALGKVGRCGDTLKVAQIVQARIPDDSLSVDNVNEAIKNCQQFLASPTTPTVVPDLTSSPTVSPTP
ncbi:MAG TPA: tetratricopeptide repeat protein [Anaerolineales bacterium]|jgi:tetratricopeptide (TPR) repeat protein|nr:tetratricopeptide repeat protein [Anaerolineales bacterium]